MTEHERLSSSPALLDDEELIRAFEACSFEAGQFRHRDHLRVAWIYLGRYPLEVVIGRFSTGLERLAAKFGAPGLYHATITWAFLILIHQRMAEQKPGSWSEFAFENADLLSWKPSILDRYYRTETLESSLARSTFVFPDRIADDRLSK